MKDSAENRTCKWMLAALLALLVGAVFFQSVGFDFITLDDHNYTIYNPVVSGGFTLSGLKGIFSLEQFHSFVPVTQLSYMIDSGLFGMKPWGFHFTNVLLHIMNALLVFAFLRRATGSTAKSFFVSALWSLHPLRAETVAWVAERNDLVAGFFFLLGLLAWTEYSRKKSLLLYGAALLAMILGGAAKPVLVTFPLILLIIDFWPLERFGRETAKRLLVEKIPFIVVSTVYSTITLLTHQRSTYSLSERGALSRLGDVAAAYGHYLKSTFWPVGLYMQNTHSDPYPAVHWGILSGILVAAVTYFLCRGRKKNPAVAAGWTWYLVALFPVSGVVTLDFYYVADHFTYLPHLGLVIALVWGSEALYARFAGDKRVAAAAGGAAVVILSVLCFLQVSIWKNDFTLFSHVDEKSGGKNAVAKESIGFALYRAGDYQGAYDNFAMALVLDPYLIGGHGNKALAAFQLGRYREAVELYKKELRLNPGDRALSTRLAKTLVMAGDLPGGAKLALENIRLWPSDPEAWEAISRLGGAARANVIAGLELVRQGKVAEAAACFREAVRLAPGDFQARFNLASALKAQGDHDGAKRELAEARRLNPVANYPEGVFLD